MPHLQVNQEHLKRSKEGSHWRLVMTVTLLNIISKINIFTFPISGDPFLFMLFNPTSWLLTMLLKLLWQLLTNSGCWKGFYFGISLTWWHFCQLAWLKAWIIHAWAVTGMIMFLHADRKPFRKFYYIVTWWITTAILLGDFFFFTSSYDLHYSLQDRHYPKLSEWGPCFNGDFTRTVVSFHHLTTCDLVSQFEFHTLLSLCCTCACTAIDYCVSKWS